jgi:hypothetical protein
VQDAALRDKLAEYDARVMGYEARLAKARGQFAFKYFQYLGLLYTEICLDRLTSEPAAFLADLNAFLQRQKRAEPALHEFTAFEPNDLRRLAFFMATGSGKTLLLHVNLWQMLHYLRHGRHPEALVRRADKRREFDSILLITPNEGLSEQHLKEFQRSGVDAVLLVDDRSGQQTFEPRVRIIEISKLAEAASGEGVSVPLESLGNAHLVFVDEGHKGTGSEARTWKNRQQALGSPPGLGKNERDFVSDLRSFWAAHRGEEPYRHYEIHLLRNMPKVGVGFFIHSGFYPDFILWARDRRNKATCVRFLDPHGMHHGGLMGNENRFAAFRQLQVVSRQPEFQRRKIRLDGFLLVATPLEQIVDRDGRDWPGLERAFPLIRQDGDYHRKVLSFPGP